MKKLTFILIAFILATASYAQTDFKYFYLREYSAAASVANTYEATVPNLLLYADLTVKIKFTNANTGPATLNVNDLGAVNIYKEGSTTLGANDIHVNQSIILSYDGSAFKMLNGSGSSTSVVAETGNYTLTISDYTVEVTTGTNTQTFPTAVGIPGKIYCVTNSGTGTVTVATTSSQTFVNITATPTTRTFTQFHGGCYQSNNTNWLKLSEF